MNPSRKIRWGIWGAGGIARRRMIPEGILPASNAVLDSVLSPTSGEAVAKEFGVTACCDEAEFLSKPIDVIYVATPVHLHCPQVIRAARAGKHVFCEKPMGLNPREAEQMVRTCDECGVKLGVGFMMRFHSQHQEALRLMRQGAIGRPISGRAQLGCWYPPIAGAWRQNPTLGGGGALADLGCHGIDLLEFFFGRVSRVAAMTGRRVHQYPVEDFGAVLLEFTNGAQGVVESLFNVPDRCVSNRLELYGSAGSILAEQTIGQLDHGKMFLRSDLATDYDAEQQCHGDKAGHEIRAVAKNIYCAQVEAFSQSILDGTDPPVDGNAGLWNQRVLAACYESARSGTVVNITSGH
jgi:predicted dehydrogenase